MNIKRAELSDLQALVELFEHYRIWYGKDADKRGAEEFLRQRIENKESVIFLAESDDGTGVGFTQLYPLFSSTRMKRLWLLNDLFVSKSYRGKGVSKQLIRAAQDHCRETDGCAITLETGKDNDIGNRLYPATGFELNTEYNFYEWACK